MNSRLWKPMVAGIVASVLVCTASVAAAQQGGEVRVAVDLPESGPAGRLADAIEDVVGDDWTVGGHGRTAPPAAWGDVLVTSSSTVYEEAEVNQLRSFVRDGGGLVYIFGTGEDDIERANEVLKRFGMRVKAVDTRRQVLRFSNHPVAKGLSDLPVETYNATLLGRRVMLVRQGRWPIAGVAGYGKGRLVVLPLKMVTRASGLELTPGQRRLLANVCYGVAQKLSELPEETFASREPEAGDSVRAGTEDPDRPGAVEDRRLRILKNVLDRQRHSPHADFSGQVVVDILAADDNWRLIASGLDRLMSARGMQVRYVQVRDDRSPLEHVVASEPVLLVIGSTRRFTLNEAIAVAQYVEAGGSVLFVAHATDPYTVRLVDISELLREFGTAVTLLRPAGTTIMADHPITRDLPAMPRMAGGIDIWSLAAKAVVKAGTRPFVSVLQRGEGRIAVIDGKMLLVGTGVVPGPDGAEGELPFLPIVRNTIEWLMQ